MADNLLYYSVMKEWESPAGRLKLGRYPFEGEKSHQAWDAADEWIIKKFPVLKGRIVITGEAFGVLSTAWGSGDITAINDSSLSQIAAKENRKLNSEKIIERLKQSSTAVQPENTSAADKLFIRLPKDLELFEVYLESSLNFTDAGTEIWIGGMDRRWNRGVKKLTDRYLEPKEIFPFERRARWIRFSIPESGKRPLPAGSADQQQIRRITGYPVLIKTARAVFSAKKTDPGTAAFLEAFPESEAKKASLIADMGCGSGILGLTACCVNLNASIIFSDESELAIRAATENAELNSCSKRSRFLITNGLAGVPDESVDLVLCNPPFHFQNIQSPEPANFMFSEAERVLKPGGTLQIVGNRHLGYHRHLKKYFPETVEVLCNDKFSVLRAVKN